MSTEMEEFKLNQAKNIANELNLKFRIHELNKINMGNINAFEIDNAVFFYPPNDGMPVCPFEFYKDDKFVLDNRKAFSQIENLDSILLQMVNLYSQALDKDIVLDPYYFMLELTDKISNNYNGKARLIVTEKAVRNQILSKLNFDQANRYFINHFLDHFIGWNFGLSVNRSEELKEALNKLNNKVIDKNLREYAGSGFEVVGTDREVYDGIQHYYLPTEKPNAKKIVME